MRWGKTMHPAHLSRVLRRLGLSRQKTGLRSAGLRERQRPSLRHPAAE